MPLLVPNQPLFGGFPGVYGLIGAFSFLIWVKLAGTGVNQLRAFSLIGALMVFQAIYGAFFTLLPVVMPSMGRLGMIGLGWRICRALRRGFCCRLWSVRVGLAGCGIGSGSGVFRRALRLGGKSRSSGGGLAPHMWERIR